MIAVRDDGGRDRWSGGALLVLPALAAMVGSYLSIRMFLNVDLVARWVAVTAVTGVLWISFAIALVMALVKRGA